MTYPNETGYLKGSETSKESAEHLDKTGKANSQLNSVEEMLFSAKENGLIADEIREVLQPNWIGLHNSIVSARLARLVKLGKAVQSKRTKRASTGRNQGIYVHTDFAVQDDVSVKFENNDKKQALFFLQTLCDWLEGGNSLIINAGDENHKLFKESIKSIKSIKGE